MEFDNISKEDLIKKDIELKFAKTISCSFPPDVKKAKLLGDDFYSVGKRDTESWKKSREKRERNFEKWIKIIQKEHYRNFIKESEDEWREDKLLNLVDGEVFIYENKLYSANEFSLVEGFRRCYRLEKHVNPEIEFVFMHLRSKENVLVRIEKPEKNAWQKESDLVESFQEGWEKEI